MSYTLGWNNKPSSLHIGLYPNGKTRVGILNYLRQTGLTSKTIQSVSMHSMHCTILYNGALTLPADFPKTRQINNPVDLTGTKMPVKPLAIRSLGDGTPIAIILNSERIAKLSNLLHAQFKLTPNPAGYIYHITISSIQLFPRNSKRYELSPFKEIKDWTHFPDYKGPLVLDQMIVSHDNR